MDIFILQSIFLFINLYMPLGVRVVVNILICFDFLGSLIPDISVLMLALIG